MMLPFLKHKDDAGTTVVPDSVKRKPDEESDFDMIESAAQDLISAVHSKDVKAVASALKAAYEMCQNGEKN